ncbi:hypothetical protein B0H66DRAFT_213618 [Apodospora peruviana]|uniref:Uncharacterized protein n=1 Tax=Apodospora peruviana TaxID=516989 RepID=A0AAE0M810_9PEZI|nr:hypothetical protein B0H66DRAFT_213618 [Apodospora peruviana]
MCHKTFYTNIYPNGQVIESMKPDYCKEYRKTGVCSHVTKDYVKEPRRHAFNPLNLDKINTDVSKSVADRLPTPYTHVPPSPRHSSPHRDEPGVYINGTKVAELAKPRRRRESRDDYDYRRRSSMFVDVDPRDRDEDRHDRRSTRYQDREPPSPKMKRSSTMPKYVVVEQEKPRRSRRDDDREEVAKDYIRRSRSSRERSRERDTSPSRGLYYRKHAADGYVIVDDDKERRQLRREHRRSTADYVKGDERAVYSTAARKYTPHRSSTIIHRSDGSTLDTRDTSPKKQVQFDKKVRVKREPDEDEDDVRARRERHNARIASRPKPSDPDRDPRLKSILKGSDRHVEELRRQLKSLKLPQGQSDDRDRGRSREPQDLDDEQMERLRRRLGRGDEERDDRSKRSKVWYLP